MSGGQRNEVDSVAVEAADLGAAARVVLVVVVGAGDELRQPRGAAGEEEDGDVAAVGRDGVEPGTQGGRVVGGLGESAQVGGLGADGLPRDEQQPYTRRRLGDLACQGLVVEVAETVRYGDGRHLGVRGEVAQFVAAVRGQRHDGGDACAQAGQGERDELPAVGQLDEHRVTGPQP